MLPTRKSLADKIYRNQNTLFPMAPASVAHIPSHTRQPGPDDTSFRWPLTAIMVKYTQKQAFIKNAAAFFVRHI
jgi:hypothetical protein